MILIIRSTRFFERKKREKKERKLQEAVEALKSERAQTNDHATHF